MEFKNAKTTKEQKEELVDMLEILLATTEFHGFTLEDLLSESDLKRNKKGGFKKRLLLEKVIEK